MDDDDNTQFPAITEGVIGGHMVKTVDGRAIHRFLKVDTDFKDWMPRRIAEYGFVEGRDFCSFLSESSGGRRPKEYHVTLDMGKELGMVERNEQGRAIRQYFIRFEEQARNSLLMVPNFSDPVAAARAWANEVEARQSAERTKAEIGSRREATAMATASTATRRANTLQLLLDKTGQYASVKRMEKHYKREFPWRPLKKASEEMGLPAKKVPDTNYEEVNTYHADVWMAVYGVEIPVHIAAGDIT